MTICFNPRALATAVLLFIALAVLATAGAGWGWARSFLGDTLAVIWVYYLFKIFLRGHVLTLAGLAFGMGVFVEMGQYAAAYLAAPAQPRAAPRAGQHRRLVGHPGLCPGLGGGRWHRTAAPAAAGGWRAGGAEMRAGVPIPRISDTGGQAAGVNAWGCLAPGTNA